MNKRLRQLTTIERLQRAERDGAAGDAAMARFEAEEARAAVTAKDEQLLALAECWYDAIGAGSFEPEAGARLGRAVIAAQDIAAAAHRTADAAAMRQEQRATDWRMADARLSATARVASSAARHASRNADEAALAAIEDQLAARRRMR